MSNEFEQAGIAAFLPGMRLMIERMQAAYDELLERLHALQQGESLPALSQYGRRRGRPPKNSEAAMVRALALAKREAQQETPSKFNSWMGISEAERERRKEILRDARYRAAKRQRKEKANGQAMLATGWPADPEERSKEMKRRMALWDKKALQRKNQNLKLRQDKRVAAAKKAAATRWGKPNGQAALSPQAMGWANMTPEARAKRAAKARASQKIAVATLRGKKGPSSGGAAFWAKLSPAQRTAEMQRRNKVAKANKAAEARA